MSKFIQGFLSGIFFILFIVSFIIYEINKDINDFEVIDTQTSNYFLIEGESIEISAEMYELFDRFETLKIYAK